MDLQLKDVADLLNVSETTIAEWVKEGKIPSYRIKGQQRFSRPEIENWVMENQLSPYNKQTAGEEIQVKGGSKQFSLYRAVHQGGIFRNVQGGGKEAVIQNVVREIAKQQHLDADVITELLLDREKMQPTALGHGIAIPHTRESFLDKTRDIVSIAFLKEPIEYGALDGEPVQTLIFLFASNDKQHLHLLAKIAHLCDRAQARDLFKTNPEKEVMLEYIREWEGKIPKIGA